MDKHQNGCNNKSQVAMLKHDHGINTDECSKNR